MSGVLAHVLMSIFHVNLVKPVTRLILFLHMLWKRQLMHIFYRLNVFPVNQPTRSGQWMDSLGILAVAVKCLTSK